MLEVSAESMMAIKTPYSGRLRVGGGGVFVYPALSGGLRISRLGDT